MIVTLAGGVGGGKFARGLTEVLAPHELTLVVNTADDFRHLGLWISPDLDSVMYAVADLNDTDRGWGLMGESWNFMRALERLAGPTWFTLGDGDLATHVMRTTLLDAGKTLSEVTRELCAQLNVEHTIVPMSDLPVATRIISDQGDLAFQEYFVARQCAPVVKNVVFSGAETALPAPKFVAALAAADAVLIAPSNPYVSIGPILALPDVRAAIAARRAPVIAVSPIVNGAAIKGPLAKMLREAGADVSPLGVANWYADLVDGWIIDRADREHADALRASGWKVHVCETIMRDTSSKVALAQEAITFARELLAG